MAYQPYSLVVPNTVTPTQPYIPYNEIPVEAWGVAGDAQQITNASITSGQAIVSGHTFVAADVGKVAVFLRAGASVSGGQPQTIITTITGLSGSNAIIGVNAQQTLSGTGIFVWGTDDTAAINTALGAIGPNGCLLFSKPGYLLTNTLQVGGGGSVNNANWCNNIRGAGNPHIYFAIAPQSPYTNTPNCFVRHAYFIGTQPNQYYAMNLLGGFTMDFMNTGLDGEVVNGGYRIYEENLFTVHAYRNDCAKIVGNSDNIQQFTSINRHVNEAGLHAEFYWSTSSGAGYIDEIAYFGFSKIAWGLNSKIFSATAGLWGCAKYCINAGSGANNFMQGHTYNGALDWASNRSVAVGYGSDQNPSAVLFADGTQSNALWGSNAGAILNCFRRHIYNNNVIEAASTSTQATGGMFAAQTTNVVLIAMQFNNIELTGDWAQQTVNINFTPAGGQGNIFSTPNASGNVPQTLYGTNIVTGQVLAQTTSASGLVNFGGNNSNEVIITGTATVIVNSTSIGGLFIIRDLTNGGMCSVLWVHDGGAPTVNAGQTTGLTFTDTSSGLKCATTGSPTTRTLSIVSIGPNV